MGLYDKLLAKKGLKREYYHGYPVKVPIENQSQQYVDKIIGDKLNKMLSCMEIIEKGTYLSFDEKREEIEALYPIAKAIRDTSDKCKTLDIDTRYQELSFDGYLNPIYNSNKSDELLSICGAIEMMCNSFENHKVWDKETLSYTGEELWTDKEKNEVVVKVSKIIYPGLAEDMKHYIVFLTGKLEDYIKTNNLDKFQKTNETEIEKE